MTLRTEKAPPGGAWTPGPATPWAPPPCWLADDIDAETGELRSFTSGVHPVDAWVTTQIRTIQASGSAVLDEGHRFGTYELVGDDAPTLAKAEVERMIAPAVARGDLEVLSVDAEEMGEGDGVAIVVSYRNLRSQAISKARGRFVRRV